MLYAMPLKVFCYGLTPDLRVRFSMSFEEWGAPGIGPDTRWSMTNGVNPKGRPRSFS